MKQIQALFFVALMSLVISLITGFAPIVVFAVLILLSFMPMPKGVALMAVTKEIWQQDIIDNLFKNNNFAARAFNEDQYVVGGKIVHIPQAGAPDASIKNLDTFPQAAVKRSDSDIVYALDTYYQKPKFVEKVEQYELSYEKRQSIAGEMQSQLIQDAMDGLLINWSKTSATGAADTPISYKLTTGDASALDLISGATGQRKIFNKDVVSQIKKAFDIANISPDGRVALLCATHYQQFLDSLSDAAQTNFYRHADMQRGLIGTYLGFEFMMRSSVQRWRKTGGVWVPVDTQAADFEADEDDSYASLFYQDKAVGRARGAVNVFDSNNRPEYYGDVFSMNMRLGGRVRRAVGITAVVEDIVGE